MASFIVINKLPQILTTSSWQEVMYTAKRDPRYGAASVLYFVSFFIIAVIYLLKSVLLNHIYHHISYEHTTFSS